MTVQNVRAVFYGINQRGLLASLFLLPFLPGCSDSSTVPPPVIRTATTNGQTKTLPLEMPKAIERHADYVGSAVCADCHGEISRTYSKTTMANSAAVASEASPIEEFGGKPVIMSRQFQAYATRTEHGLVHTEELVSPEGSVICEHSEVMKYEIGSGKRGRSYLLERDDQLMMSPLTWYSTAKRWDLSPGYAKNNLHFERPVIKECVHCHVGQIAPSPSALENRFAKNAFIEPGIGCERCHGPAGRHVDFHRQKDIDRIQATTDVDPIVNPGRLTPELRDSVCNDCHQLGVERVLRYGMKVEDFRPGEPLSSVWVIFNKGEVAANGKTDAVNQVGQMESSLCFQKSNGQLGCISCHDPHSLPTPQERVSFFRDKCLTCHTSPKVTCKLETGLRLLRSPEDSCIQCHMPALPAADVQHTSQTDHRVLRDTEAPREVHENEMLQLATSMGSLPEWEVERARGLLMVQFAVDLKDPSLAMVACELLEKLKVRGLADPIVERSLGNGYLLQNRIEVAEQRWKQAMEMDPNDEQSLRSLAIALHDAGRDQEAEKLLRSYLNGNQWDRTAMGRHIHVLGKLGRHDEAFTEAEIAIRKYPFDRLIRDWLGRACEAKGRLDDARVHREIADRQATSQ